MTAQAKYRQYREQSVRVLTAGEQLVLLFEEAALTIKKAISEIEQGNICDANNSILKAQSIYLHLIDCLDMSFPISRDLLRIYDYLHDRLVSANIKKDPDILRHALGMTDELTDTWKKAELASRGAPNK